MERAVQGGSDADFSGILSGGGIQIENVLHKAFIDVDEAGTEEAAAVVMATGSGAPSSQ